MNSPIEDSLKQLLNSKLGALERYLNADVLNKWKSHAKGITISELATLRLRIEDFSKDTNLRPLIREYYNAMDEYVRMRNIPIFIHNRVFL